MTRRNRIAAGFGLAALALAPPLAGCSPTGAAVGGAAAAGVAAAQERGLQGALSDTEIRLQINHLWLRESETLFRKVNLQVQEGRVLLSGVVPDPETRVAAVRLAWQADGVREVINEIEVADTSSLTDKVRDASIAAKLKTRLLLDRDVQSINYSIEVVNQTIYLMGIAQDRAELERVVGHAKDLAYVRRVVSYVRLKDAPRET
jgi:osmotically-inducible protein OsmY